MFSKSRALPVLILLCLFIALTVTPAYAYWPDWLERFLRILFPGHAPTPTPTATPTPTFTPTPFPAYVIKTPEEGLKLLKELPRGKKVYAVFHEDDINKYLARYAHKYRKLRSASVDFREGRIIVQVYVEAGWLKERGWKMFPDKGIIHIEAEIEPYAHGCTPLVRLPGFKVNGRNTPWRILVERTANAYLQREWRRIPFCVKEVSVREGSTTVTGYKK